MGHCEALWDTVRHLPLYSEAEIGAYCRITVFEIWEMFETYILKIVFFCFLMIVYDLLEKCSKMHLGKSAKVK